MAGKGKQPVSPDRVLSPSNPFQSALDKQNKLLSCLNVGQTGNPFARKEHVPCATVLSTMNGPNRKLSPKDTSTVIIDSFFKHKNSYGDKSIALGTRQVVEQQPTNRVVERGHVPRKTVQVSLASLKARKKYAEGNQTVQRDTKVGNSGGPIDLEPDLERFHQSVAHRQHAGVMHPFMKKQWRTSANGFKPPRVVDPDAHKRFASRQEAWMEGGTGEMENTMNVNKQSRATAQGESGTTGLMKKMRSKMPGSEAPKAPVILPTMSIEEINLVDDDEEDDLTEMPCRGKSQDRPLQLTDVELFDNGEVQHQERAFPSTKCKESSPYQFKGTGVAIFDEFSSEYCDSDDGEDDGMGWDDDGYGAQYEKEIAGTEWDESPQEERDINFESVQALSKPESRLENATIMVGGQRQPWWKRLTDFVPISALRSGYDPRNGSKVHIDYMGQFKGTRSKESDEVGTSVKKKQARTTKTADGYWVTEDGVKSFVTNDGNRLTGKAAYAAYLKKKQGKKPSKKRKRRTKKSATKRGK